MNMTVRIQLSVMMFLEFFIWGVWAVTMTSYLDAIGFSGREIGLSYTTTAWAAIISPFFVGMVADRFFSAQKVLGVLHLLGGVLMYFASTINTFLPFFVVLLLYAICYMPTLALVNAISFYQMTDTEKEFPPIRVLGTLGWIIAGGVLSLIATIVGVNTIGNTAVPLQIAAGVSILMGLYSFTLPKTPPKSHGERVTVRDILGLDTLKLMKSPSFTIFVLSSFLISIPLAFYYNFTHLFLTESGMSYAEGKMTLGQMSEVVFLLVMPFFFRHLGVKYMLITGMLAWAARYMLFAFGNNESLVFMFYLGILLHGICYDFFFVVGQIYVDKVAPKRIQANAQGFIALITYGAGMAIGGIVSGMIVDAYALTDEVGETIGHAWMSIWLIPAGMALLITVLFGAFFREETKILNNSEEAEASEAQ